MGILHRDQESQHLTQGDRHIADAKPYIACPASTAVSTVSVVILALLAVIYSAWPVWRALFPMQIDPNEPWNAYQAMAARAGGVLYPDQWALTVNNYPPLSFYFVGIITSVTGLDPIYFGRFLSLAAVVIIALCTARCVRLFGGSRLPSALAGLWLSATIFRFFDSYVGMNDPHLPALAFMALALVWAVGRHSRKLAVEPAIVLMAVAGFYKHNLIATPMAVLLWLGLRDWWLGLRAALVGLASAVVLLIICVLLHGEAFLQQLMMPRVYSGLAGFTSLGQLQWIAPALAIWAIWAWCERASEAARFTTIYVATGFLAYVLQKLGAGIGLNAQFELATATAIGLGLALSRVDVLAASLGWRADHVLMACVSILIVRLLASSRMESYLVLASSEYRAEFTRGADIVASEIEQVRSMPGPVLCRVLTVCFRAGKAFVFDEFAIQQRLRTGRVTAAEIDEAASMLRVVGSDPRTMSESLHRRL
jgi:hypothetical protein